MNQFPTPQAADPPPAGWQGSLNLIYANRTGTTQLVGERVGAPLKVQRPFYPEGAAVCHSVILHTAGGVVGGDRLCFDITLHPDTRALITTAAAGKIYRTNGLEAKQTALIKIAAGACLEWLPQETIVYNNAIYRQDLRVELEPGASVLIWEIARFGRSARGEQFLQGFWRSHTEIWQQGRPLWIDRQQLIGGEETLNSPHGLAAQPVVGSLAWIGVPVTPELVEKARSLFSPLAQLGRGVGGESLLPSPPGRGVGGEGFHQGEAGATRLTDGLLCRYRGNSTAEVRNWFIGVWQLLRQSFWGSPACPPRVWPT